MKLDLRLGVTDTMGMPTACRPDLANTYAWTWAAVVKVKPLTCRLAKLRRRQIKSGNRYRRSHRCRSSQKPASSQSFTDLGILNESQFRAVGIIRHCERSEAIHGPA